MVEFLGDGNALMYTKKEPFSSSAHATSWSNVLCSRLTTKSYKVIPNDSRLHPCHKMILLVRLNEAC